MDKEINLEEIFKKYELHLHSFSFNERLKEAVKEACKQALELAAENIKLMIKDSYTGKICSEYNDHYPIFDKQSILDTINQIK